VPGKATDFAIRTIYIPSLDDAAGDDTTQLISKAPSNIFRHMFSCQKTRVTLRTFHNALLSLLANRIRKVIPVNVLAVAVNP
jgi:hypothetical protein